MCGFAGIFSLKDSGLIDPRNIINMTEALHHRGPDATGYFKNSYAHFGHKRLSIVDLSQAANQPMWDIHKRYAIVYNGEIYNHLELRKILKNTYEFKTSSDTEVILAAFQKWGSQCIHRFNGVWSFVILDTIGRSIFCSRDRLGVRPFYYTLCSDFLLFSSEIKSLLEFSEFNSSPNEEVMALYLKGHYGFLEKNGDTFFKSVYQLPAGSNLFVGVGEKLQIKKYWSLRKKQIDIKPNEIKPYYLNILHDAIRLRLSCDVPIGISLSGGIDSTAIACLSSNYTVIPPLKSFSSHFDEPEANEFTYIQAKLDQTKFKAAFTTPTPESFLNDWQKLMWHHEQPYYGLSMFAQWEVLKLAKEHNIKVLLNGQGSDEVLAGYTKFLPYYYADLIRTGELAVFKNPSVIKSLKIIIASKIAQKNKTNLSYVDQESLHCVELSPLPSLLHIDDRNSMAFSIETRAPFLDYRLIEFTFSLPFYYKISNDITKKLLRDCLQDKIPSLVLNRKDKMGFPVPMQAWLRGPLKSHCRDIFSSSKFRERGHTSGMKLITEYEQFINGKKNDCERIWRYLNLEQWLRTFLR